MAWKRQQDEIRRTEDFIRRNMAGQNTKQAQSRRKKLAKLERLDKPREEHTRFRLRLRCAKRGGNVVLQARGLDMSFGSKQLFRGLDLELSRGEKVGIVGPNGSGKTTLLQILAGRLGPDAGRVRLGSDIEIGYFDQELDSVGDAPNLMEEIWRLDRSLTEEQVRATLGAFGFGAEFVERPVRVLSGGQRSRLALLELMLANRNFLVLDEPTNHLDLDSVSVVEEALRDYEGTLLVVSHDRLLLSRAVRKLVILSGGHARLFHGGYEEYVQSLGGAPLWSEIAALEAEHRARQAKLVAPPARDGGAARAAAGRNGESESPAPARPSKNTLAKLRKQLDAIENEIVSLEVDLEELEQALSHAHRLTPEEIEAAARRHGETKSLLAQRYAQWDELSEELEAKKGGK